MDIISPKIVERDTKVIPVQERVAVALQFLATTYSYTSLQYLWRIYKQISEILPEVIIETLKENMQQ